MVARTARGPGSAPKSAIANAAASAPTTKPRLHHAQRLEVSERGNRHAEFGRAGRVASDTLFTLSYNVTCNQAAEAAMSPTIRIGQDTYEPKPEPLIDTPDSVIRRLLGLEADEQHSHRRGRLWPWMPSASRLSKPCACEQRSLRPGPESRGDAQADPAQHRAPPPTCAAARRRPQALSSLRSISGVSLDLIAPQEYDKIDQ